MVRNGLHNRFANALAAGQVGVLSAADGGCVCAMPAQYRTDGLEAECLLPRWCDLANLLDDHPTVMLTVLLPEQHWIQVRGTARPVASPNWEGLLSQRPAGLRPEDLYLVVRIQPVRIDIFDPNAGWGSRETLDL